MMFLRYIVLIFTGLSLSLAGPTAPPFHLKERIDPPRNWIQLGRAPVNHVVTLRIALPQPNFSVLEQHLYAVSDPGHARYGEHLSKEEVESLVAPHPASLDAVEAWLLGHGLGREACAHSPARDWIAVDVPVRLAEEMLDTRYHVWKHALDGDVVVRTMSYSLPPALHAHIALIQPTTMFARLQNARSTLRIIKSEETSPHQDADSPPIVDPVSGTEVDASCNRAITIRCLQQLYNFADYAPSAAGQNQIGVTGYLEQFANFEDLQMFYKDQRPEAEGSSFNVSLINGGRNDQNLADAGSEGDLDVQFAFGLAYPTPGVFYSTGGRAPFVPDARMPSESSNEPFIEWLHYVLVQKSIPYTISTSYGDDEQTVPRSYAERLCQTLAQLGARGVSVLFSSGDFGVGDGDPDPRTQQCQTNDGRNATRFIPAFPASCPYVTSVGGTQHIPEVAVSRFFSGGGFSDYFARPAYQNDTVSSYLDKLPASTYEGLYNKSGRAFPDVSAQGDFFRVFLRGRPTLIGGTSASSPTFAAVVALLNDARIASGLPPLGFLNPLLYAKGVGGLNDVTVGHNLGCGTPGFNATQGWDPVTGLGTPNFGKLKDIVLSG